MPERLVLDASVALAVLLDEPAAAEVMRLLSSAAGDNSACLVPDHFWLEVANVLVRRHAWETDAVVAAFRELDELGVTTVQIERPLALLGLDLMAGHRLSSYDAAYLALAVVEDAALLTLDVRLAAAAGDRAVVPGSRRVSEAQVGFGAPAAPPAWAAHGRYLAELRRRAGAQAS